MTRQEYEKKIQAYKSSSAPVDVKEKAIKELQMMYGGSEKHKELLKDIYMSQPDVEDILEN